MLLKGNEVLDQGVANTAALRCLANYRQSGLKMSGWPLEGPHMPAYSYTTINDPFGTNNTTAGSINASGQITGDYIDSSGNSYGFLYSGGRYTTIDDPFATMGTFANSINASGQITGYYHDANGFHGFLYSGGSYTTLNDPLATNGTFANSINASGQITGFYQDGTVYHGFLYSGGRYTTLDDPFATNGTVAQSINASGQITGYYLNGSGFGSGFHGFLYSGGSYTTIDDPLAANDTVAQAINASGQITGYYQDANGFHGFLYSGGSYTTIDDPFGPNDTTPLSINASGQITGYYRDSTFGPEHGFLYSDGSYTTIDLPLATNTVASDINDSGQITGSGDAHGFLATPVITPPVARDDIAGVSKHHDVSGNVLANDSDPNHEVLTVTGVTGATTNGAGQFVEKGTYGTLFVSGDGDFTYQANKKIDFPDHALAQDTFSYTATNTDHLSSQATLTVTVVKPGETYIGGKPGVDADHLSVVTGGNGKQVIDGSLGFEQISGGNGKDVLVGGPGDVLTGGRSPDTFVFSHNFGANTITDFEKGHDTIELDKSQFHNFAAVIANAASDGHDGTLISDPSHSGNTVDLLGVNIASLHANHFFFV
jgi:hypothetical protein